MIEIVTSIIAGSVVYYFFAVVPENRRTKQARFNLARDQALMQCAQLGYQFFAEKRIQEGWKYPENYAWLGQQKAFHYDEANGRCLVHMFGEQKHKDSSTYRWMAVYDAISGARMFEHYDFDDPDKPQDELDEQEKRRADAHKKIKELMTG